MAWSGSVDKRAVEGLRRGDQAIRFEYLVSPARPLVRETETRQRTDRVFEAADWAL